MIARELKKTMEHKSNGDTNCNWRTMYSQQRIDKRIGALGNKRTSGEHPNDSITKFGQNTKKNSGLEEICCHSNFNEKPSANADVKNSQKSNYYYYYYYYTANWKKTVEYESDGYTIVIGALGTVTKGLIKGLEDLEIRGRVETIQTTALLRSARILRRVLETWGDLSLITSERLSAKADVKNSHGAKIMKENTSHINDNNNNRWSTGKD